MKFIIDGREFSAIVTQLDRKARIKESGLSGDVKNGRHFREIVGTYYDYDMTIATNSLSRTEYDELYEILTSPQESHFVKFPYGQSEMEYEAYITTVNDSMKSKRSSETEWYELSVMFEAIEPQRRPT